MNTRLECFPCLLNQALKAARAATDDEYIHRQVIDTVAGMIPEMPADVKPPEIAQQAYRIIHRIVGNSDPYSKEKAESNETALAAYPRLKQLVENSADNVYTACKLAISGNSIDLGPANFEHGGLDNIIETALDCPLAVDNYKGLKSCLRDCRKILYLGDNAGEIVFDRLLIEKLGGNGDSNKEIYFVVRGEPVINDATMEDALAVGMDRVATVISSESDAPAIILSQCSQQVRELYQSSDVVIAKGQGNYESLEEERGNVFFLLRAKCPLIAELLGVQVGDFVLKENSAPI